MITATTRPARRWLVAGLAAFWQMGACSQQAAPRPQVVLVVDTDAWVVSHLVDHPEISRDAAIDTLRVDGIDRAGHVFDVRQFALPDARDWPVSFGAIGAVRFRLRAFRAMLADVEVIRDQSVLLPPSEVTIDRLVDVVPGGDGIDTLRVVLRMDCLGTPVSFLQPAATCVDGARMKGAPSDALESVAPDSPAPTRTGTWGRAGEVPCTVGATADRLCIAGGFTILGDASVTGLGTSEWLDAVPLRPVVVSPVLMDRTEFTVGRFRALVESGRWTGGSLPQEHSTTDDQRLFCTWLGTQDGSNDDRPLNCIKVETAEQACALEGGALPTEAQWEHAARGRGQRRRYAWGDDEVTCCAASASRKLTAMTQSQCSGFGIEPVGSHPRSEACNGLGDVSRDGLLDLSGGLSELMRDRYRSYADACWSWLGIATDPACIDETASLHISRGGSWDAGLAVTNVVLRSGYSPGITAGFRCVYEGASR